MRYYHRFRWWLDPEHLWRQQAIVLDISREPSYIPDICIYIYIYIYIYTQTITNTNPDENAVTLQWRHNESDDVSKHQRLDCLLNRLFRRRSMKTAKFCATGLCEENSPVTSPHKGQVTWKPFPFDDVIMSISSDIKHDSWV